MESHGFAEPTKKDVTHDAGTVAHVRPAGPADLEAIAAIEHASCRGPLSPSAMTAVLADPDRHIVVAVIDGAVVGWGKTHYWDHDDGPAPSGHYLGGVTVLPAWRRRGVGAALTEARLRWVWARAAQAWYVVNADNLASIGLHRRWNFTEVARGPGDAIRAGFRQYAEFGGRATVAEFWWFILFVVLVSSGLGAAHPDRRSDRDGHPDVGTVQGVAP